MIDEKQVIHPLRERNQDKLVWRVSFKHSAKYRLQEQSRSWRLQEKISWSPYKAIAEREIEQFYVTVDIELKHIKNAFSYRKDKLWAGHYAPDAHNQIRKSVMQKLWE